VTKKEIVSAIELRQSTIKDYLACPLMFRFKHLEKIEPNWRNPAMLHGSVLHKILELLHTYDWNLRIDSFYREYFDYFEFEESPIPVYWKGDRDKELDKLVANAIEIIEGYRKNPANQNIKVIYSEQKFRVKIAGYMFTGTIDQVRQNADGSIELLDFKSSKQMPTMPFLYNDHQLNLYTYALKYGEVEVNGQWVKPKLLPDFSSWYFLRAHEIRKRTTKNGKAGEEKGQPLIRTQKSIIELRQFREQMKQLLKVMLKDWHFPNTNHCNLCAYTTVCVNRATLISKNMADEALRLIAETEAA